MPKKSSVSPKLERGQPQEDVNPNAPALICINDARGYVKGNVMVVSQRAAMLIEHLRELGVTPDELRVLADFFERAATGQHP